MHTLEITATPGRLDALSSDDISSVWFPSTGLLCEQVGGWRSGSSDISRIVEKSHEAG